MSSDKAEGTNAHLTGSLSAYKDLPCAIIFLMQLIAVLGVFAAYVPVLAADLQSFGPTGQVPVSPEVQGAADDAFTLTLPFLIFGAIFSLIWAALWITVVRKFTEALIWIALVTAPVLFLVITIACVLTGIVTLAIVAGVITFLWSVYAVIIIFFQRYRIDFAALTLRSVAAVITLCAAPQRLRASAVPSAYPGTLVTTFLATIPATVWQLFWLFTVISVGYVFAQTAVGAGMNGEDTTEISSDGSFLLAFLVFSNYWTAQVISNVVHVTISGVFGTWYFFQGNMPASPTYSSLMRALTTSFGSICFGSLVVAIVRLIRDIVDSVRKQQDTAVGQLIMCCVSCCIGCIEWLLELFNHFAFVQVAIYGKSFMQAAKDTFAIAKASGITALINMNLTTSAVVIGELAGGFVVGISVAIAAYDTLVAKPLTDDSLEADAKSVYVAAYVIAIIFGFLCALLFTGMVSSTVTSGVTTIFICWAEDPAALYVSNPELHDKFEEVTSKFLSRLPVHEQEKIQALGGAHSARWPAQRRGAGQVADPARDHSLAA